MVGGQIPHISSSLGKSTIDCWLNWYLVGKVQSFLLMNQSLLVKSTNFLGKHPTWTFDDIAAIPPFGSKNWALKLLTDLLSCTNFWQTHITSVQWCKNLIIPGKDHIWWSFFNAPSSNTLQFFGVWLLPVDLPMKKIPRLLFSWWNLSPPHAKGRKGFRGLGRWKDRAWWRGFHSVLGDQKQNHEEFVGRCARFFVFKPSDYGLWGKRIRIWTNIYWGS